MHNAANRPLYGSDRPRTILVVVAACLGLISTSPRADDNPVSAIIFGSLDAGPSTFVTAGAKLGLERVDREGVAGLVSVGTGFRRERDRSSPAGRAGGPPPTIVRHTLLGAALGGYQWFYDWGVVAAFAGPEGSVEALSGGPGFRTLPARFGLRLQGEVWARPNEDGLITATLILGSAREDAYGRLSYGHRLWGAYLGPEIALYGDRTGYRKWTLGLHATDLAIGRFSLRASGGYLYETGTRRGGPYFALAVWTPL